MVAISASSAAKVDLICVTYAPYVVGPLSQYERRVLRIGSGLDRVGVHVPQRGIRVWRRARAAVLHRRLAEALHVARTAGGTRICTDPSIGFALGS